MAYDDPTPDEIRARFTEFAGVTDDTVIQAAIDRAKNSVDDSWPEEFYTEALTLRACHEMVLDGLGSQSGPSQLQGLEGVSSFSIDDFSVTMNSDVVKQRSDGSDQSTKYGRRFAQLRSKVKGGGLWIG